MAIRKTRAQLDAKMDRLGQVEPNERADQLEQVALQETNQAISSATKDESRPEPKDNQINATQEKDPPESSEAQAESQPTEAQAESQPTEAQAESQPTEAQAESQPTEAQAESQPTEAQAESQPTEAQAESQPTEAQAESQPTEAQAESQPTEAQAESQPTEAQAESQPTEAQAESQPTEAQAESQPTEAQAESQPTEAQAESQPTEAQAESQPTEAQAESQPTEAQTESQPTEAQSESTEDADPSESTVALHPAKSKQIKHLIESLLFASSSALSVKKLSEIISDFAPELTTRILRTLIEELRDDLRETGRGIRVVEVGGCYQLRTPSEAAPYVRKLVSVRPPRLTRATLETLAIVAYRQPITRPEIEDIRGVDCGAVLKHLLDKKQIKIMGRKEEVGRPLLYATTQDFLSFFNLKDLRSLPTLKDFVELSDEHRAQLGIDAEQKQEPKKNTNDFRFTVSQTDSYNPVGQDEVIEELSQTLASIGEKNRNLQKSGVLENEEEQQEQDTECTQPTDNTNERSAESKTADSPATQSDE